MTIAEILAAVKQAGTPVVRVTAFRNWPVPRHARRGKQIHIGPHGPLGRFNTQYDFDDFNKPDMVDDHGISNIVVADFVASELIEWANAMCRTGQSTRDVPRVMEIEPFHPPGFVTLRDNT